MYICATLSINSFFPFVIFNKHNSCPYFRNEVGGEQERIVSLTRLNRTTPTKPVTGYRKVGIYGKAEDLDVLSKGPFVAPSADEATHRSTSCRNLALLEFRNGSTHWQHGICPYAINLNTSTNINQQQNSMLEAVDVGANYYRDYFYKQGRLSLKCVTQSKKNTHVCVRAFQTLFFML